MPTKINTLICKLSLALLVSLVPFTFVSADQHDPAAPAPKPARLTGGFLQLNNSTEPWWWARDPNNDDLLKEKLVDYGPLVGKFRDELLMNTIVIQNLQYTENGTAITGELIPKAWEFKYGDPLIEILTEANKNEHALKTYLGLEYNQALFDALGRTASVNDDLDKQIVRDSNLAKAIAAYTDQKGVQFDGWYITTEIGNFDWSADPNRKLKFANYISKVADVCYEAKPLPIAISPYYNARKENLPADKFAEFVRDVLAGSKVSIVMMQDGIGASPYNSHKTVIDFFTELRKTLPKEMKVVADVELFKDGNVAPTPRILDQLRWQTELGTPEVLGFDIMNYLSPMPSSNATEKTGKDRVAKGDAKARKDLYDVIKHLEPTATSPVSLNK